MDFREVTEQERALENFQRLFDLVPDMICIASTDGYFKKINRAWQTTLGYTEQEILSTPFLDFIHPDDRDATMQVVAQGMAGKTTVEFSNRYRCKNGNFKWLEWKTLPPIDGSLLFGCACDITERKQTEISNRSMNVEAVEAQALLQTIFDSTPDWVFVKDRNHRFLFVNKAFADAQGFKALDMVGRSDTDFWSDELCYGNPAHGIRGFHADDDDALAGTLTHNPNDVATLSTGEVRIFDTLKMPLYDAEKHCYGVLAYARDVTDRKDTERQLRELNEKLEDRIEQRTRALTESLRKLEAKELANSRFLAAAGHDLRQPLAAANLFIDALKSTEPTAKQNQIIQRLDQSMVTFSGLLDSLLNISKLDSGVIKPELTPIKVTEVFNWLDQSFAQIASEKQLGFKLHFPIKETLVFSDKGLLNSILTNLVSNAIKFTSKGAILISARKRGNEVLFQVWDTGIGIPEEHIKHIFDEFYQVGNPQRDRTAGLGLGLAIAKRAITLLGSEITCRSQRGRGSVFEFRLPLDGKSEKVAQQAAIGTFQADSPDLSFVQGKHFVVVEDDLLVAQALTQSLESLGGEVECFHSAEDALRYSNIRNTDCYIVDYMLSGMLDGIEFLNLLRQKLDKPINAVLMTGDTSSGLIQKMVDLDWPVLHKPVSMLKLISVLCASKKSHI